MTLDYRSYRNLEHYTRQAIADGMTPDEVSVVVGEIVSAYEKYQDPAAAAAKDLEDEEL